MILCNYCDYLKSLSSIHNSNFCNMFKCEYSNHTFIGENFDELIDYPCCILSNSLKNFNADLESNII